MYGKQEGSLCVPATSALASCIDGAAPLAAARVCHEAFVNLDFHPQLPQLAKIINVQQALPPQQRSPGSFPYSPSRLHSAP